MQITFFRQGHSNNSSSSHSLIFTRGDLPESNENSDFGWQHFTCSSKESKLNYLLFSIRDQLSRAINFPYLGNINDYKDKEWSSFISECKGSISKIENSIIISWIRKYLGIEVKKIEGYVDHQSQIYFPFDRSGEKLHAEFARDFINEFVNGNWYIFGGNDNDMGSSDSPTVDDSNLDEKTAQYAKLWSYLTDSGDHLCVKDELTGEYVLSNTGGTYYNGAIVKVKF
jgi:hypothetical protein